MTLKKWSKYSFNLWNTWYLPSKKTWVTGMSWDASQLADCANVWLFISLAGQTALHVFFFFFSSLPLSSYIFPPPSPRPWSSSWWLWPHGRVSGIVWCSHGAAAAWWSLSQGTAPAICGRSSSGGVEYSAARPYANSPSSSTYSRTEWRQVCSDETPNCVTISRVLIKVTEENSFVIKNLKFGEKLKEAKIWIDQKMPPITLKPDLGLLKLFMEHGKSSDKN